MKTSTNNFIIGDKTTNAKLSILNKNSSFRWVSQVSGGVALSVCYCLLAASGALAESFSFTKIADSGDFSSLSTGAAINDSGKLAFIATPLTGLQGVYTSTGEQITEIVNQNSLPISNTGSRFSLGSNVSINNSDTVAFIGTGSSPIAFETRVFVGQNGSVTERGRALVARGGDRILNFALNNQDEVVYLTNLQAPNAPVTDRLILSRPNQPNVNIATGSTFRPSGTLPPTSFYSIGGFGLNNQGEVTFGATRYQENPPSSDPDTRAIFTSDGSSISTLLETNASALDVNDNGDVVLTNQNVISLFNRATGTLRAIANTTGLFQTFSNPAINNNGKVAFTATLDAGQIGIFTGSDPVANKVIATGDALAGSTVTNVNFVRQGLNNNGQIAFYAQLANGTTGIFRADPPVNK